MSNRTISYPCEALVDQERYVGEDPIGHKCCGLCEKKTRHVFDPKEALIMLIIERKNSFEFRLKAMQKFHVTGEITYPI